MNPKPPIFGTRKGEECKYELFYKGVKIMATKADRTVKRTETRKAKEASAKTTTPQEEPIKE